MSKPNLKSRTMWTGDNLPVIRGLNSESVERSKPLTKEQAVGFTCLPTRAYCPCNSFIIFHLSLTRRRKAIKNVSRWSG